VLRLALNCDYDRIMELANEHGTLRQMLGHGWLDADKRYGRTTIVENVSRITPEVLGLVNWVVVAQGHRTLGKEEAALAGRCDSFVVETDVHYPTDGTLLLDAMRKILRGCGQAQGLGIEGVDGWRQHDYQYRALRTLYRKAQRLRPSSSQRPAQVEARQKAIQGAYRAFLNRSRGLVTRVESTLAVLQAATGPLGGSRLAAEIERFLVHAHRQIDQLHRRVILGERIPHEEKVFSVFEEHTEWVSKGKAGVPVELGVRTAILEDQFGFILHARVMAGEVDPQVPVWIIREAQILYPQLHACSFDKGFYTPDNLAALEQRLDHPVLPKKGKWSEEDRAREGEETFVAMRRQHPAVESAINALEVHGLDRCPDHGLVGLKRYVAWAVVGRNLLKLGVVLLQQEREERARAEQARRRRAA